MKVVILLFLVLIFVSHRWTKFYFEVGHRWYLHNYLRALKKLHKLSFKICVANYVWVFSLQIYLCLFLRHQYQYVAWNWAFHEVKYLVNYNGELFQPEYWWYLWLQQFELSFFTENNTSWADLLGPGSKNILQL